MTGSDPRRRGSGSVDAMLRSSRYRWRLFTEAPGGAVDGMRN